MLLKILNFIRSTHLATKHLLHHYIFCIHCNPFTPHTHHNTSANSLRGTLHTPCTPHLLHHYTSCTPHTPHTHHNTFTNSFPNTLHTPCSPTHTASLHLLHLHIHTHITFGAFSNIKFKKKKKKNLARFYYYL